MEPLAFAEPPDDEPPTPETDDVDDALLLPAVLEVVEVLDMDEDDVDDPMCGLDALIQLEDPLPTVSRPVDPPV